MDKTKRQEAVITDLQLLRTDLRSYISHKENTAYITFAFSVAVFQYFWTAKHIDLVTHIGVLGVLLGAHVFMRTSFRFRARSSSQRWAIEGAIAYAIANPLNEVDLVCEKGREVPTPWRDLAQMFFPMKILQLDFPEALTTYQFYRDRLALKIKTDEEQYKYYLCALIRGRPHGDELPTIGSLIMIVCVLLSRWC